MLFRKFKILHGMDQHTEHLDIIPLDSNSFLFSAQQLNPQLYLSSVAANHLPFLLPMKKVNEYRTRTIIGIMDAKANNGWLMHENISVGIAVLSRQYAEILLIS